MEIVDSLIIRAKDLVVTSVGLIHAMLAFKIMVPAAISLAPALIRGRSASFFFSHIIFSIYKKIH